MNLFSEPTITIPWNVAVHNSTYIIILSVKTQDTKWQNAQQIVHFKTDVFPVIEIK